MKAEDDDDAGGAKPKLRGIPHLLGAMVTIPAAIWLYGEANPGIPRVCAIVYGTGIFSMLALSATYHTPMWTLEARARWRLVDHAMIFIQVGVSYSPICLLSLPQNLGYPLLAVAWGLSLLGFFWTILSGGTHRRIRTAMYWICGWIILPVLPQVYAGMDRFSFQWLLFGGVTFCVGSVTYVTRKPNLVPGIFGYHELFHCFVVAGFACHFIMVWHLVTL